MLSTILLMWSLSAIAAPAGPKPLLSQTGLYNDIQAKTILPSNLGYSPQYPLWTDGALKRRWISLPPGTRVDSRDFNGWRFPRGTKVWKEFSFPTEHGQTKRVETRLLEKTTDRRWQFAAYLWNSEESEAVLAPENGVKDYYPIADGLKHDIPSVTDCMRCHRTGADALLGFDGLSLSADRDPLALHAEPSDPNHVTLPALIEKNLLSDIPEKIETEQPRILASTPEGRAAMGYIHANCGSCHNSGGSDTITNLSLMHPTLNVPEDQSPVFLTGVGKPNVVFFPPGQPSMLRILPGDPEKSAFVYRMTRISPEVHMPPIGSKRLDTEAIRLLSAWITSLRR